MLKRLTGRGRMLMAILIFVATASYAIVTNGLLKGGINLRYSISQYVGLATGSSVLFALGNFVVVGCMASWLYEVGRSLMMPKLFYGIVVLTSVMLIGLSVCPYGYFDTILGMNHVPTTIHQICSRTMFICMLVLAIWLVIHRGITGWARFWCALYAIFAAVCVVGFIGQHEWMLSALLLFEASYLLWFMLLITNIRHKDLTNKFVRSKNERISKKGC